LSLIPEDDESEDREDSTKYCTYKLAAVPGSTTNTNKYSFTMLKVDGTQSIRAMIKWTRDVGVVFKGLQITTPIGKHAMMQEMCSGSTLTAFNAGVNASMRETFEGLKMQAQINEGAQQTGETFADRQRRRNNAAAAVTQPAMVDDDHKEGLNAVLTARCPYKVLEKQKRFMRRKMRKPHGMTTRQYVNHLQRINETELIALPPFKGRNASFSEEEFKEIILFGIPNSWKKDMDKFDFDPYEHTVKELVEFCERMEASDDTGNDNRGNSDESPKKKSKSSKTKFDKYSHKKKKVNGEKWCDYHETDTHTTAECTVMKKLKASKGEGNSTTKKQWKSKSDYAKDKAKKELNTLKKKAKKVKLELNAANKTKRKSSDSDDHDDASESSSSYHSVNMLERSMKEVDEQLEALTFSDNEEGEVL